MLLGDLYKSKAYLALTKSLDTASLRQKVIANNIANVDTPHFKRAEVRFEDTFKEALEKAPPRLGGWNTDSKHIPINSQTSLESVKPEIFRQNDEYTRSDDNNVDIDIEMAELAKTELMYNALSQRLSDLFKGLKAVIRSR